jgi:predicted DNA-binding transcriptional regulator AlpA
MTKILEQILQELRFSNADNRLWSIDDIAHYLGTSKKSIQNRIICKPGFPEAISIPVESGSTNRRWYPSEVKKWIASHRNPLYSVPGRPRQSIAR